MKPKDMPTKEEVWIRIVEAYTASSNSAHKEFAVKWADFIADEYEKRFGRI